MDNSPVLTAPATDDTLAGMKDRTRLTPKDRKDEILMAAGRLAVTVGWARITRDAVALEANVGSGLVTHYFENMTKLRQAVMREAIKHERLDILAQGLALRDPAALKAPADLIARAWATLAPPART